MILVDIHRKLLLIMVEEHCDRQSFHVVVCEMGSIPARFDISFIKWSSVVVPRDALQRQILSTARLNFLL